MKTAAVHRHNPRRPGSRAPLLLAAALVTLLAGCKTYPKHEVAGWMFADPAVRYPIEVGEREISADFAVPRGAPGLSRAQIYNVGDFVHGYKKDGKGPLLVRAPNGTPNEVAAMRALDDLRHTLRQAHIPGDSVVFEPYYGGGDPKAPIRLSYLRYVAKSAPCGDWDDNVAADQLNIPYPNFGCAAQQNLAAMVADPRDLVEPRDMTPRSSERRDTIWGKWIRGEPTAAKKSADESADVSDVESSGSGS